MGYETKLLIGKSTFTTDEIEQGDLIIEDGEGYRPYLKDDDGNYIKTGRKETWFQIYATIDLCKCGYDSNIYKLDTENKDESSHPHHPHHPHIWYWYEGEEKKIKDCYGKNPKPVPIKNVIKELEKDIEKDGYRRFKWALALLKSMEDDSENIEVIFYGH